MWEVPRSHFLAWGLLPLHMFPSNLLCKMEPYHEWLVTQNLPMACLSISHSFRIHLLTLAVC